MKCENCGKNIANVHYKANYNGNVTEKHLCSDCAAKMGLNNNIFGEDMFNDFFDGFFGRDFFRPFGSFGMMPVMAWLKLDLHTASVTRFDFRDEFDSGYATARCSYINDISHLKAAGLAEQKE